MSWDERRIEHLADEVRDTVDPGAFGDAEVDHYSIPALDTTGKPETQPASQIQSHKQWLRGGEVLLSRLNPRKARVLRVPPLSDRVALASSEFVVLRPHSVAPRFLEYVLLSEGTRQALDGAVQSVTRSHQRIRPEQLLKLRVAVPTERRRQRAIADFLDNETARIDALITKKRRMIALLDQRDSVLIEAALSRTAVRDIPLRRLLLTLPKYGAGEAGLPGDDGWPRYIRITDLTDTGALRSEGILRLPPEVARPFLLEDGDLLLARSGATVGKAFLYRRWMGSAAFAGYLIQFRPDQEKVLPGLLEAWTRTQHYWSQVRLASLQATIENVSAEKYKDFVVPLVPRNLQEEVLAEVGSRREKSRLAGAALQRQIELLREHRQALITAAVTGELQVPGAAA